MKKIIFILITFSVVHTVYSQDKYCDPSTTEDVNNCKMQDGAVWLKDFNVYMKKCCAEKPQEVTYTMVLTKGKNYRFVVKNSPKFLGKLKVELVDEEGNEMFTAVTNDNNPKSFDVFTSITCPYKLKVTCPNGEEGCGAIAIYYVKDL